MILKNLFYKNKLLREIYKWMMNNIDTILYVLCILIIAINFGLARIYISNFNPINGDFQNYNIFRRALDGQIPYKEFSNYLGMGILLINLPLLCFSNSFTSSLFVTNFTTSIIFSVSISILFYICTNKKKFSYMIGAVSPIICQLFTQYTWVNEKLPFYILYSPGNSMRMQRAFLPFMLAGIFIISYKIIKKVYNKSVNITEILCFKRKLIVLGSIIGLFMVWSNDFGYACFASALMIIAIILLQKYKRINLRYCASIITFIVSSFIAYLISISVISLGNIKEYIEFTLGVSKYQFWYYGTGLYKLLTFNDIFKYPLFNFYLIIFIIISAIFLYKVIKTHVVNEDILVYFIELSTFFANLIYMYGSGSYMIEAFSLTSIIICISYVINIMRGIKIKLEIRGISSFILIITICFSSYKLYSTYLMFKNTHRNATYIDELKGYTNYGEHLKIAKNIIGNEQIFSTYATALETMLNKYQPSGTDYIIHVLGDEQRKRYMHIFNNNNYKYVTTIKENFSEYESWIKRANWFFYRELYSYYKPSFSTDYSTIWIKDSKVNIQGDYQIKYTKIAGNKYDIIVTSSNKNNIVADVKLNYKSISGDVIGYNKFIPMRRIVGIQDDSMLRENNGLWNTYFIPNESDKYNVPIFLKNGIGKITISSYPDNFTNLEMISASVNKLLPNYYFEYENNIISTSFTDQNWDLGINRISNVILLDNTQVNRNALKNATKLKAQGKVKSILNVEQKDANWIWVTLDNNESIEGFSYPNKLEVIK